MKVIVTGGTGFADAGAGTVAFVGVASEAFPSGSWIM